MSEKMLDLDASQRRQRALSSWDDHSGVESRRLSQVPPLTDADMVQLRIRVVALENVVIALLAEASDRQFELVREMATYISPRHGFTQHPLSLHAAAHMVDLAERADHFRAGIPRKEDALPPKMNVRGVTSNGGLLLYVRYREMTFRMFSSCRLYS